MKRTRPFHTNALVVAIAIGLCGPLIIAVSSYVPVPQGVPVFDFREVFVLIGAALTGPVWGMLIGIIGSVLNVTSEFFLFDLLHHVISGFVVGYLYRIIFQRVKMPALLFAWGILVWFVYYGVSAGVIVLLGIFDPIHTARMFGGVVEPWRQAGIFYRSINQQFFFALVVSVSGLVLLPKRFRRPLWVLYRKDEVEDEGDAWKRGSWYSPLGLALAFGAAAYLVIWAEIVMVLPGSNAATDPREIFVAVGAALTGPLYGVIVGLMASVPEPNEQVRWYVILQHVVSSIWVSVTYWWFVYRAKKDQTFILRWIAVLFGYYYVAYIPGFLFLYYFAPKTYMVFVGNTMSPLIALPRLFVGWFPEFFFTTMVTALVLYVLPPRFRRPLWITTSRVEEVDRERSSPERSLLGVRLTLWFLLLSLVPLLVIGVFIRNDVAKEIASIEARQQLDLAKLVAAELQSERDESAADILAGLNLPPSRHICILDRSGLHVAQSDSTHAGKMIQDIHRPETAERVLNGEGGWFIDSDHAIGFIRVPESERIIISATDRGSLAQSINDLERFSYLKLSTSLMLLSVAGGFVIWIIVARPMKRLTWAADQVAHGNLQPDVDASKMDDEVKLLAQAFNAMTTNLRRTHQGLEGEIVQRRLAEDALRISEHQFRLLAENSTDMISRHDSRGRYLYASPAALTLTGYVPGELLGLDAFTLIHPDDHEAVRKFQMSLMDGKTAGLMVYRLLRKDGGYRWVESTSKIILNEHDRDPEYHVATRDITRRKEAEDALIQSETRLRSVISNLPVILFVLDERGTFTISEGKGLESLGLDPGQVVGQSFYELYREMPLLIQGVRESLDGKTSVAPMELQGRVFEAWLTPMRSSDGHILGTIGVAVDITDRKRMEEALRASEILYKALVEQSTDAIYVLQDRRLVFVNKAWESKFGYSLEEVLSPAFEFSRIVAPVSLPLIHERFATFEAGGMPVERYEMVGITKSGEHLDLDVSVVRIEWKGRWAIQGIYRDITERKRTDALMLQKQKMESLGILAGGVAHDFNNLLQAILGHLSLSIRRLTPEHPAMANMVKAESATERAADLTRQLLAYSGRGKFDVRNLSLNSTIQENLHLLEVGIHKSIRLDKELTEPLPAIQADPGQVQQVVMNLIINASEAIGERPGHVLVRTSVLEINSAEAMKWSQAEYILKPGSYVCLEVSDDGSGMNPETIRKIFDPFFTTKFTGRGLGLSAVIGIVRGHHGGITVESQVGKGTTFRVVFPAVGEYQAASSHAAASGFKASFTGSVLVIDDEAEIREVVVDLLEEIGVKPIVAPDGLTGVEVYKQNREEISLVLLDMSMPGLGGKETFRLLKKENPDIRVVMTSGFSESEVTTEISDLGLAGFIQKPYRLDRLMELLRSVRSA